MHSNHHRASSDALFVSKAIKMSLFKHLLPSGQWLRMPIGTADRPMTSSMLGAAIIAGR